MPLHKIGVNAEFSVLIVAAPQEQAVDLLLGNEAGLGRGKALPRTELLAGREQVDHIDQQFLGVVDAPIAQKRRVTVIRSHKLCQLLYDLLTAGRCFQQLGELLGFIGEALCPKDF